MFPSLFLRTFHITTHLIIKKIIRERYSFYFTNGEMDIKKLSPVIQEVCALVVVLAIKPFGFLLHGNTYKWPLICSF